MLQRMNTGSLNGHFLGYDAVLTTGTSRSMLPSTKLICRQTHQTPVLTLVTSLIHPTLVPPLPHPHSPLVYMWMTLFTSQKIPRLNGFLNLYSLCLSRSTLWEQWNGFQAHNSSGTNQTTKYQFTSAKPALRHIWSRIMMLTCATSHPMPPCIVPVYPSIPSLKPMKKKTVLPSQSATKNIKVWLAQLVGQQAALNWTQQLAVAHSFLSTYNNTPSLSHWNAALYILHYIHLTIIYKITFMSNESSPLHAYMFYPHASDTEAYSNAIPSKTPPT